MPAYSQRKISSFITRGALAGTTTARGRACEDLGEYIFTKFRGVELVFRDQLDAFGGAETDLVFRNVVHESGLYFLEPVLIVECKNYSLASVSSQDVEYFASRLAHKGARSGIILTTTRISGGTGRAGVHALEVALVGGITILVIDADAITSLTSTESLTVSLFNQLVAFRTLGTLQLT